MNKLIPNKRTIFVIILCAVTSPSVFAGLYHVEIDLTGLVTPTDDVQVNFELWDLDFSVGSSHALVDNVLFNSVSSDFDTGFEGFSPGVGVSVVDEELRLDEDLGVFPTVTFQDYFNIADPVLSFDLAWNSTDLSGLDFFRVTLLDANTFGPLATIPDLDGFGAVFDLPGFLGGPFDTAGSFVTVTTITVIPLPASSLLCIFGMGTAGLLRRMKRFRLT